MVAGDPLQGGASWAIFQYVLGLRQAGHQVHLIEPVNAAAIRPAGSSLGASHNAAYFRTIVANAELEDCCTLLLDDSTDTVGQSYSRLLDIARRTEVLMNVSGMLQRDELVAGIPVRAYLDLDPAFNQLWHSTQGIDMRFGGHTHFVTVGNAVGGNHCPVPTCGLNWVRTFPPIVLKYYSTGNDILHDGLTTIGNWRGYGSIQHEGVFYGQKAHSFRQLLDLPKKTSESFTVALAIHPDEKKDLDALSANGWKLVDPALVAGTPRQYMEFIRASKAELGIAKSGYVASRSGWVSDRSACYLAFGRPVVAQETGFSDYLPCGEGLFRFRNEDDVLAAIDIINGDYQRQSRAARDIANEYFDSGKVLSRLLAAVGAA
jgi:hypothetical protein